MSRHPHDWRRDPSQPRIIRKVVRTHKVGPRKGKPKVARDYKTEVDMERVQSMVDRVCESRDCPAPGQMININEPYALVIERTVRTGPFINGTKLPRVRCFHFDCVPKHTRPLVRFLL
jgi:hypothetical protein